MTMNPILVAAIAAVAVALSPFPSPAALEMAALNQAASTGRLYFTEHRPLEPRIKVMDLDGSTAHDLFIPTSLSSSLGGIGVDERLDRVFWVRSTDFASFIAEAALDGAGEHMVLDFLGGGGMTVDPVNHRLIWFDGICCSGGAILSGSYIDGSVTVLSPDLGPLVTPYLTTVPAPDSLGGNVYFAREFSLHSVPALGGREMALGSITIDFGSIAPDVEHGVIYHLEAITGTISRIPLDGSAAATVILHGVHPSWLGGGLQLDHGAGRLYWLDVGAMAIESACHDGSDLRTVYVAPRGWAIGGFDVVAATQSHPADLDGDGAVDGLDLPLLLAAWGRCPACSANPCWCPGDLNEDGIVNGLDLAMLLAAWTG